MTEPNEQTVYMVEKFIPTQCPNPSCFNEFKQNGADGYYFATYWMHEPREVTERISASISHPWVATDLIVCGKCRNVTVRVKIEDCVVATREDAEALLNEGYVNLQEMQAHGVPPLGRVIYRTSTGWRRYAEEGPRDAQG